MSSSDYTDDTLRLRVLPCGLSCNASGLMVVFTLGELGMSTKKRWRAIAGRRAVLLAITTVASFIAPELAARLVYGGQARRREAREALARELHSPMLPPRRSAGKPPSSL